MLYYPISKRGFFLFGFLSIISFSANCQFHLEKDSLDARLKKWLPDVKENTPGCVVGIMYRHSVVYTRSMGSANIELNVPLTDSSVFNIGSIAKQFTGFAVMQLEQAGKLKLTDRVSKYLPEYQVFVEYNITIDNLLHHTSGLRELFELMEVSDNQVLGLTMDQIKNIFLRQKKLNFPPGQMFEYNNANYWFLALLIEKLSGTPYPRYIQEKIFVPLDMKTATVLEKDSRLIANRTSAYKKLNANTYERANPVDNFYGPGGIYCALNDLFKWGSGFSDQKIGNPALYENYLTKGTYRNGITMKYASGLYIDDYKGIRIIEHEGSRAGYTSQFVFIPEKETIIVILANIRNFPVRDLYRKIMDYILEGQFPVQKVTPTPKPLVPATIPLSANEMNPFTGLYWNDINDIRRRIYIKNDTLIYQRTSNNESALLPVNKNTFVLKVGQNLTNNQIRFSRMHRGKYGFTFLPEAGDSSFYKQVDTASKKDRIDIYTGLFYCEEIDTKFEIRKSGNGIVLYIKGWDPILLENGFKDYFFNTDFAGSLHFLRNKSGRVISFNYTSARTKNLLFRKINSDK